LKKKRRYLALGFYGDTNYSGKDLFNSIVRVIKEIFGELGLAETEIYLLKWIKDKNIGIIRCGIGQIEKIRFATIFLRNIDERPIIISVLRVSGTIKDLKEKLLI
jgi:RNase P/RNase MRP subunit POP5